jgi:hypothetical protein
MSATESKPIPDDESESLSGLKIESWDDVFRVMCIIKGVDPSQIQSMAKFTDFDNNDERSYYANQYTSVAIAQLRAYGKALYFGHDWDEYTILADFLSVGFMGFKGFKSEQYKDITSGQPNLEKIKGLPEETQKGILSGIFGGKKE